MTHVATYGWESLAPHEGGNRLLDRDGTHQVSAKVRIGGACAGYVFVKVWTDEPAWTHIVLDPAMSVVAQGYGSREKDSWEMTKAILARKGIAAAEADIAPAP